MRLGRASLLIAFVVAGGCGSRQHQQLGMGRMQVQGGGEVSAAPGVVAPGAIGAAAVAPVEVALPAQTPSGTYQVSYQIWLPRAMEVAWTLRCAGHEEQGTVGETVAAYRERRVAELRAERERQRQQAAQVGAVVGGAVLGQVGASATVATPGGYAQGTVAVDGAAAGAAVGAAAVADEPIVLAPDDLGQGYRQGRTRFWLGDAPGACTMTLAPVDPAEDASRLAGSFTVERWFDAERAQRVQVAGAAGGVRGELRARLIAQGGDPDALTRRRAAAYQARLEAEAQAEVRAQAEAEARVSLEARVRTGAWQTRAGLHAYLQRCGGDPYRRQRLRAEEEARVRVAFDLRGQLSGRLVAHGADPGYRARLRAEADARAAAELAAIEADARARAQAYELALGLRAQVAGGLVARGARVRPPMPDPIDEEPGVAPRAGAAWVAGAWQWDGGQWRWTGGYWRGGEAIVTIGAGVGGAIEAGLDTAAGAGVYVEPAPERPRVQDHAPAPAPAPGPAPAVRDQGRDRVQDHTDDGTPRKAGRPRVQDHR